MLTISRVIALAAMGSALSACYVVPLNQYPASNNNPAFNNAQGTAFVPITAVRPPFSARLYPSNEAASRIGNVAGVISNPERGHGEFSFNLAGESFIGEATRAPSSTRGVANASGNRGGFVKCDYAMSSASLGTGTCLFSNGAQYSMHISQ
ncbi:hypothetical protein [Massilia sp. CF038]|uniref:hypothetical protein n=1 Tax=Massilia sp. CF038 TaxID=1881045 RepID=UPI0009225CCD|nr:hypothetical protein [Massilia sp. CF038]SHH66522.1 hypothetical protein SAMN05428948_4830 [Massilia sp. CF038]